VNAARDTPDRILLIDGDHCLTAAGLHDQAQRLAQALLARFPVGSVISFMLPNWQEAAVIYMGATLAGMVANPILPSLRDHDLRFILADVDSRMILWRDAGTGGGGDGKPAGDRHRSGGRWQSLRL
jgi:acyl-CoA synthetase (AMP-forming)/AMP-acid ligase II